MLSGLDGIQHFNTKGDVTTLAQRWKKWKEEFELFLVASGVTKNEQKRALLFHKGGEGLRILFKTVPADQRGADDDYATAIAKLDDLLKDSKNVTKERQKFLDTHAKNGETLNNYITRLTTAAEYCEYGTMKDSFIKDKAVNAVTDKRLKGKLTGDKALTLTTLLEKLSTYEFPEALILKPVGASDGESASGSTSEGGKSDKAQAISRHNSRSRGRPRGGGGFGGCYRCGEKGHFSRECPVSIEQQTCERCGHKGHAAARCRTKNLRGGSSSRRSGSSRGKGGSQQNRGRGKSQQVRSIQEEESDDECYYVWSVNEKNSENECTIEFLVDEKPVRMLVDSGSTCDIVPESVFKMLNKELVKSKRNVYAYNSDVPLDVLGLADVTIRVPETGESLKTKLTVVKGSPMPLLGRNTAIKLGVLRIGVETNKVCALNAVGDVTIEKLKDTFPSVFKGLGKLKDCQLKLHIDDSVVPVAQPVRRIPFSRRERVTEKLNELLALDVIEKVDGPSPWVNPLVAVEKPNGEIRICLDMRTANTAILRQRHPIPTVEETLKEMSGGRYFSKLDLNMGYHQIELEPDSRDITTFAGPNGLYRYKRLLFGINMASEKFQALISQAISGCEGAYNISDDIVIVGMTRAEHDARLSAVVKRLFERGLTLNAKKCEIGVNSINYMGHILTDGGLKVSDDKVKAIKDAPKPVNKQEMRSFLGSVQFCAKFIKNFGTISEPLWQLTKSESTWKWGKREDSAFRQIKERLMSAPVMAYFQSGAKTRIITDASPVGLGAVLEQEQEDGEFRTVYYASRKLTAVESRYSQFEREALAIRWACQKFHLFVYGIEFDILTDHRPLIAVFNGRHKPPNARLERMVLSVQPYSFNVHHIPGKLNSADGLSRLPIDGEETNDSKRTEDYAFSVVAEAVPAALKLEKIDELSADDNTLQAIRQAINSGDWRPLNGTGYTAVRNELWTHGNLVMRDDRIVIPTVIRKQVMKLAHEGHQGMTRTKARLRQKVWWPSMNSEVEELIRACHPCQLVGPRPRPEPIRSTPFPPGPWTDIAIDLCGPLPGGDQLFVIVDYYSRWPEVIWMKNTTSKSIIKCLERVFQVHGLPETIRSDNGPQFASEEFTAFCDYLDIKHQKGIPFWPQSNGEVERFNETLIKIVKIANAQKRDLREEVGNFLLQYRSTPHSTTGVAPSELLMGRKLRDKLPSISRPTESDWQCLVRNRDARRKAQSKQYADQRRHAVESDIQPGDSVLMPKKKDNKLSCNYEEEPCVVLEREGNAVTVQTADGVRMRNTAHVKKFVPSPVVEPAPDVESPSVDSVESPCVDSVAKPSQSEPAKPPDTQSVRRSSRNTQVPAWTKDYVVK